MDISDEKLVAEYIQGDENALEELVRRYLKPIYSYVFRMIGFGQSVDDLTQDVFIKVWKNINSFDEEKIFSKWIFAIAHNTIIDHYRKKKNYNFSDLESGDNDIPFEEGIVDVEPLQDELFMRSEELERLEKCLDKLTPMYREIVVLHYMNEMTFDEIAKLLSRSLNTVKSQHRRAVARIRQMCTKISH
jgi:RNA polymerase sigma-70 factor (ECF subfamily)